MIDMSPYVSICLHMSPYVSICLHVSWCEEMQRLDMWIQKAWVQGRLQFIAGRTNTIQHQRQGSKRTKSIWKATDNDRLLRCSTDALDALDVQIWHRLCAWDPTDPTEPDGSNFTRLVQRRRVLVDGDDIFLAHHGTHEVPRGAKSSEQVWKGEAKRNKAESAKHSEAQSVVQLLNILRDHGIKW